MSISALQVKELRDKTGAGMMDCKKALTEADGNFEKAIEILRKKGASVAAKRAERSANEGLISAEILNGNKTGIILEVKCETDFVAKSDNFVNFSNFVLDVIKSKKPANVEELKTITYNEKNVAGELTNLIGKIGEKIEITRFHIESSDNGQIVEYVHHGSKLGVLLRTDNVSDDKSDELTTLLKDIAMQVAAMKPINIYREDISKEIIEKEIDIYKEVARKEGKPENILEKIANGKLNKFYQENCLFEQAFVKDNTKSVGDLIKEFNDNNSSKTRLVKFHRFHVSDEK